MRQGWFQRTEVVNRSAKLSNHLPGLGRDSSLSKEESVERSGFTDFYPKYSILKDLYKDVLPKKRLVPA
jgi:hypothetical protein